MKTLTAFYDLAIGPPSFDFVVFGIKAEMARRRAKADRLHIVIVPMNDGIGGMFRDKRALYDEHEMRWRLWNICIPACQLLGASVTLATDWEQARALRSQDVFPEDWDSQTLKDRRHLVGDVITASRAGEAVPRLNASRHARRKVREWFSALPEPVVTLTVRKTYLTERNSDVHMWLEAREHIGAARCHTIWIEDTSIALGRGYGYAELNLDLRMAVYQEAALNLQANNGAASLCWFSDRPYRMFGAGVPADEWSGLFVKQGLPLGETWPWALPGQKVVYGKETADTIIAEFEAWNAAREVTA